jgi:ribosomal protein S18 acetylase RimI-like enzyme
VNHSNANAQANVQLRRVDFNDRGEVEAFLQLLDMYAQDPMGSGQPLEADVMARLPGELAQWPGAISLIAWAHDEPVGLVNGFLGYSTFKARPLMNVHDIAVVPSWRGQGVGRALLSALESEARQAGCCKLTLEVLSGNTTARQAYERYGFEDYALDPRVGVAGFMQKWL